MNRKVSTCSLKAGAAIPIMLLLCLTTAFAQTTLKGTVTDAAGNPLPGVSVTQQGSKKGTVTDQSGKYSLVLTNNSIIIFSSIGFVTKPEAIRGRNTINVTLTAQNIVMDEVVVTSLGI